MPSLKTDELQRLYLEEGLTFQAIGDRLGVSRETVRKIVREMDVKVSGEARRLKRLGPAVERLYVEADKTVRETAESLNVSKVTVSKVLRSLGIPVKKGGKNYRIAHPELRTLKIGESVELPRMNSATKYTYVRYYGMAKTAGIKVSVSVISGDAVRVTRTA